MSSNTESYVVSREPSETIGALAERDPVEASLDARNGSLLGHGVPLRSLAREEASPATAWPWLQRTRHESTSPLAGRRILYAIGGPVDVIGEHDRRYRSGHGDEVPLRTSLGDMFELCERHDMQMHVISTHPEAGVERHGRFVLEHRPKRPARHRLAYHANDIDHARHLIQRGRELGADTAIIESGVVDYFLMAMLERAGMKVIPLLHHTLWPVGHPPRSVLQRARQWINGRFFRERAEAVICVSAASARQVRLASRSEHLPIRQMRLQLDVRAFERIATPPPHAVRPFGILYTGRIERYKGAFDLLEMATILEQRHPGQLRWYILGDGTDREALLGEVRARGLGSIVELPGWISVAQLGPYYRKTHVSVVPTRSEFVEGMAMAAIEAVIAGRPVVTCAVVPALEEVEPACVEARVDDVGSYVEAIERLMRDEALYEAKRAACMGLGRQFFDARLGMASIVEQSLGGTGLAAALDGDAAVHVHGDAPTFAWP